MHLYDELNEIPVPKEAHSDGYRVYTNYPVGNNQSKKLYIGQYANKAENTFYANENFRLYYPTEWAKYYEKSHLPHYQYNVGMYAMTLQLSHRIQLYPILHEAYGPLYGNALLDFAMYSIMERSNVAYRFKPAMEHEVIFSKDRNDDDWLSKAFNTLITEDMTKNFKIRWIQECKKRKIQKVWISVDGSNNDCECSISELPAETHNKSKSNKTAVGYMYAISTETGDPVTFTTYYGDEVDSKAFIEICEFIQSNGMEIEGIILDRGFLSHNVLKLITEKKYQFVIMLKNDTYAHTQMIINHGEEIYWNVEHLVGENGLFGISDGPKKIFLHDDDEAYINLFFDGRNGSERKIAFLNKVYSEIQQINQDIENGKVPAISDTAKPYLNIEETVDADGTISRRIVPTALCNNVLYKKGFESIATSKNYGPYETNRIYHLRDASEKQFMVCKNMVGCNVFRTHSTEGVLSRSVVCFIASIVRNEIAKACKALGLKPSIMLPQIERPALALLGNGTYKFIANLKDDTMRLFESVGCKKETFEIIAGDVNEREQATNGKGVSQYHRTPEEIQQAHLRLKQARKQTVSEDSFTSPAEGDEKIIPARHPGRPKGSKNKKTLEKEALEKQNGNIPTVKRNPGRPKGSKNKKTLDKETTEPMSVQKRKRGRPIGSRDKTPRTRRTKQELAKSKKISTER